MNAKEEFIRHIEDKIVQCAQIYGDAYYKPGININLLLNHSKEDYDKFLQSLDFEYDGGYGGQELFGYIWYKDGTWSERGEYDGSEWWEYKKCPEIPNELK